MKYKIFFSQLVITGVLVLAIGFPLLHAFASQEVGFNPNDIKPDTLATQEAPDIWGKTKIWGISVFKSVDAWRAKQLGVWVAIKAEKKEQLDQAQGKVESDRDARVDSVLEGEQVSLYNGAGEELEGTGNVFLLKLYSFVLGIFIIIFKSPIIFYAITVFLIVLILSKIIDKIRGPRRI